jgi:hypothetical protein
MTLFDLLALTLQGRAPGTVDLGGTELWWDGERVLPECLSSGPTTTGRPQRAGEGPQVRTSEQLLARLREEAPFDIPDGAEPERLYHGRHQRNAGAWSWMLNIGSTLAGSQHTMRACVEAQRLDFSWSHGAQTWSVDPIGRRGHR